MQNDTSFYWRLVAYSIYTFVLVVVGYFWFYGSFLLLGSGLAGTFLALAQFSGLIGMISLMTQFVIISRAPWLERGFGFDKLTRIHRKNGLLAFTFITAHIPLVILSAAISREMNLVDSFTHILLDYLYVPLAGIGYVLLLILIGTTVARVYKLLKWETWFWIHLLSFAILLLVFWHQVNNGATLLQYEFFRYFWYGLFIGALVHFVVFQTYSQLWKYFYHRFRVDRVVSESGDVVSIYVRGRHLEKFRYVGGQFAKWRFLTPELGFEEHPFTISVEPNNKYLRLTPKSIGDYTSKLRDVKSGTPVIVSGPLGRFTLQKAGRANKILLIAGGIGITPLRSMIGDKLALNKDIVLLYSVRKKADIVFVNELKNFPNVKVVYILSDEKVKGFNNGAINKTTLAREVPDINDRQIFICGPPSMMDSVTKSVIELGVSPDDIYTERFSL